jgi:Skp family chaperone for outer membrane proteins
MRQAILASWACVIVVGLAGCGMQGGQKSGGSGNVAVIDLDEVSRRLGRDVQMASSIRDAQSQVNDQLRVIQTSLQKELDERKGQIGEEAEPEKLQELQVYAAELNQTFAQSRQQGLNELRSHQQGLIARFRDEVKPIAQAVAAERGMQIVVTKNEMVVYAFTPTVDITEEVISRMAASAPAAPSSEAPGYLPEQDEEATPISDRSSDENSQRR